MRKIILLSSRADYGGGPEHIISLLRGVHLSYDVVTAAPDGQIYTKRFSNYSRFFPIPFRKFSIKSFFHLVLLTQEENFLLIHSHGRGAGFYARLLGRLTGIPVIHTFHGFHYRHLPPLKRFLYLQAERVLSRWTEVLLNVSESEHETCLQARIFGVGDAEIVPNGVVVPPYSRLPRSRGPDPNWVLINVARHEPEKGVDGVIRIAAALARSDLSFELWLVGDGVQRGELEVLVASLDLQNHVRFLGFRDDVGDLLQQADIFVSASLGEGMPLTILEAMAAGLPTIASDVVGNRDVVEEGVTGHLFPLQDIDAGTRAVLAVLQDERRYSSYSHAAYETARSKYSVEVMCDRIAAIYERVMMKKKKGRV